MTVFMYAAVVLIGYFVGSIPFGLFISRKFAKTDIRNVGSGKIGMTNVLRTAGKKAAALSLVLDMAKGAIAVLCAQWIFGSDYVVAQIVAGLAAIAGHSWSIFLKFKGGRGVATFLGGLLAMYWPAAIVGGIFMIIIGYVTRYMSLGSIIGAVTAAILLLATSVLQINFPIPYPPIGYVVYAMICAIFIYVMHRDNIMRLFSGTERRLGETAEKEKPPASDN